MTSDILLFLSSYLNKDMLQLVKRLVVGTRCNQHQELNTSCTKTLFFSACPTLEEGFFVCEEKKGTRNEHYRNKL